VLGQTSLGFKLSVAQILVTIGVCAVFDTSLTLWRRHTLVWPASAILTGNGVAFILRAAGTRHGDWWSFNGIGYFIAAALIAMLSKHLIRPGGRHLYNPSNLGLVAVLLLIGSPRVFPQYLWWGSPGGPVSVALVIIAAGALWILRPVGMWPMALSFLAPFAAIIGVFAATGRSFVAIWHTGPIAGGEYWLDICTSPELLIFVFFMMSDPRTAPHTQAARMVYGAGTAVVAAALILPQPSEFGVKVALLASLALVCSVVPLIERLTDRVRDRGEVAATSQGAYPRVRGRVTAAARIPAVVAIALIAIAVPLATVAVSRNSAVLEIERTPVAPGAPSPQ
jgi:Na+-translocating ferredoxin:NAD+ oxidoreductase RnfD subunit